MSEEPLETRLEVSVAPDAEAGHYASFVSVWHTLDSFVLDFATVLGPAQPASDAETGARYVHVPARIISRVRIPPQQVFELMKALEQQLSAYERETGKGVAGPA